MHGGVLMIVNSLSISTLFHHTVIQGTDEMHLKGEIEQGRRCSRRQWLGEPEDEIAGPNVESSTMHNDRMTVWMRRPQAS